MERDGRLQAGRAELLQARVQLQEKDDELITAYQRLTEACQQRSAVRAALIGTQTELAATSAELDAWTHEIATFQTELAEMVSYSLALPCSARGGSCCCNLTKHVILMSKEFIPLCSRPMKINSIALRMGRPQQMPNCRVEDHPRLLHLEGLQRET